MGKGTRDSQSHIGPFAQVILAPASARSHRVPSSRVCLWSFADRAVPEVSRLEVKRSGNATKAGARAARLNLSTPTPLESDSNIRRKFRPSTHRERPNRMFRPFGNSTSTFQEHAFDLSGTGPTTLRERSNDTSGMARKCESRDSRRCSADPGGLTSSNRIPLNTFLTAPHEVCLWGEMGEGAAPG